MPAQSTNVTPAQLLAAAASAASTAERAAAPQPGAVPVVAGASPTDAALATVAAGIAADTAQMCAAVAGKGPVVHATTATGVAKLEAQDAENAAQIGSVPQYLGRPD